MSLKRFSKRFSAMSASDKNDKKTTTNAAPHEAAAGPSHPPPSGGAATRSSSSDSSATHQARQKLQADLNSLIAPADTSNIKAPSTPEEEQRLFEYLQTIGAVRERCRVVFMLANRGGEQGHLRHFTIHKEHVTDLVNALVQVVKRDYIDRNASGILSIPAHGRWQHLEAGDVARLDNMIESGEKNGTDKLEITRRLLDLFVVSVLLDAGAGNKWTFKSNGQTYRRSEGLAVASFEMFASGAFSSAESAKLRVDSQGLRNVTSEVLSQHFQADEKNPLDGLEGRAGLLSRLADALEAHPQYFGTETPRPGNMIDFILNHESTKASQVALRVPQQMSADGKPNETQKTFAEERVDGYIVPVELLWEVLIKGLRTVWPEEGRQRLAGKSLGDVWLYPTDHTKHVPGPCYVPFHKLTQWMCYSLMAPMTRMLHVKFQGEELLTGLPEYRNGGLLLDFGLLRLNERDLEIGQAYTLNLAGEKPNRDNVGPNAATLPTFNVDDPQIVEWRAVTVGFLDYLHKQVQRRVGDELTLAQFLEAASWKLGREMAEFLRPTTKSGPILIKSDGTVF